LILLKNSQKNLSTALAWVFVGITYGQITQRRMKRKRCKVKLADYLIETSDRCIRIANHGRQLVDELDASIGSENNKPLLRVSASGRELADELDSIGRDLLAKAVELDTERHKGSPGTFGP
jgi:hypothetical protein